MKKVNKKMGTFEQVIAKEESESKKELLKFIKTNPGATLCEMLDSYGYLDEYEFLKDLIYLFDKKGIVSDSGYFFPNEVIRQKMSEKGLY
jgi:hypothetical protein